MLIKVTSRLYKISHIKLKKLVLNILLNLNFHLGNILYLFFLFI